MNMMISTCGLPCDKCEYFNVTCEGCRAIEGKPFWAKEMTPSGVCPLYDCAVNKKNLIDCGYCETLPCEMFYEMKDPKVSDEEHRASIQKRVNLLMENKTI